MTVREVRVSGRDCLALVTDLLRRIRSADPFAGQYEAADFQWWWRRPRRSDEIEQVLWIDDDGPVAAAILTEWSEIWECDLITTGAVPAVAVVDRAMELIDALALGETEIPLRDDDIEFRELLVGHGFEATGDTSGICWMDAGDRPEAVAPADGFMLIDRRGPAPSPHPMIGRNGALVEQRLRECSLYDPALDLAIQAPDGQIAGYALFWHDPVTGVGLVEPMRVEDAFQRRGLARVLLAEGLRRLAERGSRRMKVGYSSPIARALYLGAGFQVGATCTIFRRKSLGNG